MDLQNNVSFFLPLIKIRLCPMLPLTAFTESKFFLYMVLFRITRCSTLFLSIIIKFVFVIPFCFLFLTKIVRITECFFIFGKAYLMAH